MTKEPYYKAHWRQVDENRMAAYRDGFQWGDATELLYQPAELREGLRVADDLMRALYSSQSA